MLIQIATLSQLLYSSYYSSA